VRLLIWCLVSSSEAKNFCHAYQVDEAQGCIDLTDSGLGVKTADPNQGKMGPVLRQSEVQWPRARIVDVVRALQITRVRVKALDVGCRVLSLSFAAQLVDPRDLLRRQTVPFRVKGNREQTQIIGERLFHFSRQFGLRTNKQAPGRSTTTTSDPA
jgi:hypothetical protein